MDKMHKRNAAVMHRKRCHREVQCFTLQGAPTCSEIKPRDPSQGSMNERLRRDTMMQN